MYDSTEDTLEHIGKVQARLQECISNLTVRAAHHDRSKLWELERSGYDIISAVLADYTYGTHEFNVAMAEARTDPIVERAIQHHYEMCDHHPEHTKAGISGMSLLALIEWLADCKAASGRSGNTFNLAFNIDRFGIDAQLAAILENTVKELGW